MSERRPVWKHRVTFSKNRNVSIVLWPPGTYRDHPTPPSISLEEGSFDGDKWMNTRITLTLDKAPNIIQDLQIAYAKALELQREEEAPSEAELAEREGAKPADPIAYLKTSILETMTPNKVYPRQEIAQLIKSKHTWPETIEIEEAISQLLNENRIKAKFEKLTLLGFTKA